MNEHNASESRPKFTRGEKCILVHLVLTVVVIIVLIIIYLGHIIVVKHSDSASASDTRRSFLASDDGMHKLAVGLLYVNVKPVRNICNTLLLKQGWSISAGHCVAMRSDPHLSYLFDGWMIKYPYDIKGIKIIKNFVHPNFSRDTFAYNLGLIQHNPITRMKRYKISKLNAYKNYNRYYGDMEKNRMTIISWDHGVKGDKDQLEAHNVQSMKISNCSSYISPIIDLRKYEFCVVLKKKINITLGHGAVILNPKDLAVYGIFAWGEREPKVLPLVVLSLSHFKKWLASVTSFSPLHGE